MAKAMRARVPPIRTRRHPLIDTCGTGGDNAGTFNISTTVALVTAACGVAVAKHGNRAVSSRTGSADVLESLGVRIDLTPESAARSLDLMGITFLFAPNYHTSLRHAAGPRREIGVRTVFNVLGPLTNPAGATRQLLGVFSDALVRPVTEVLRMLGSDHAWVVHGRDGMDEITVFGNTHVAELEERRDSRIRARPGFVRPQARRSLRSGGRGARRRMPRAIRAVLAGQKGAARGIVVLNSGAALHVAGVCATLEAGLAMAENAIDRGLATDKLDELVAFRD